MNLLNVEFEYSGTMRSEQCVSIEQVPMVLFEIVMKIERDNSYERVS